MSHKYRRFRRGSLAFLGCIEGVAGGMKSKCSSSAASAGTGFVVCYFDNFSFGLIWRRSIEPGETYPTLETGKTSAGEPRLAAVSDNPWWKRRERTISSSTSATPRLSWPAVGLRFHVAVGQLASSSARSNGACDCATVFVGCCCELCVVQLGVYLGSSKVLCFSAHRNVYDVLL
jgi:hypothetical protein